MERPPKSILIIGSGLFGLGTAWALTKRAFFDKTAITVVDNAGGQFPPPDSASVDNSRIVRADYADADYMALGTAAQAEWRKTGENEIGGEGRYSESGLVLAADESTEAAPSRGTGYVRKSYENVVAYAAAHGYAADKIQKLESSKALGDCLKSRGHVGDWGYLNSLSGWADNGRSMRWLYERVAATQRVTFVDARVDRLETEADRVVGAVLSDGIVLRADVVMVAAGAWTGELVDLRGKVEASGHAVAYVDVTDDEQAVLSKQPVVFQLTSGVLILPPRYNVLRLAIHDCGHHNPQSVADALPLSPSAKREPIVVSRPLTSRDGHSGRLPRHDETVLRSALANMLPVEGLHHRPWRRTRLCWYSDTKDGNWLVDWHPNWKGLFLATGDSGHGFKFLPVIGEEVVDCLVGKRGALGRKWSWRWHEAENGLEGREVQGVFRGLVTMDESRAGGPASDLRKALAEGIDDRRLDVMT